MLISLRDVRPIPDQRLTGSTCINCWKNSPYEGGSKLQGTERCPSGHQQGVCMTLISILLGLALVYFLGPLDRFRDFSWFEQYSQWLESRCNRIKLWDGPTGVVLTLALPLCLLLIVTSWLGSLSLIFPFIISIGVFVYSLGADPNRYFDSLISILADQDEESLKDMLRDLGLEPENIDQAGILRALLLKTH